MGHRHIDGLVDLRLTRTNSVRVGLGLGNDRPQARRYGRTLLVARCAGRIEYHDEHPLVRAKLTTLQALQ